MKKLLLAILLVAVGLRSASAQPEPRTDDIKKVMKLVADWQMADYPNNIHKTTHTPTMWTNGAMYVGMAEWAKMADDDAYFTWLKKVADNAHWQPHYSMYFADDVCVSQLYCQLYEQYKNIGMIQPTQARLEWVMNHPSQAKLGYYDPGSHERWCWCDALFMAPPAYARMAKITGEEKYLSFMDKEFWATYDLLYDKDEHLFYRDTRYLTQREKNGNKIFWGRGNGWVIGGLAIIIDQLPENHPTRPRYITLFQEMMGKVVTLQDEQGFWHAALLDYDSYPTPETSCSGFFAYGLAWGINRGYLSPEAYKPSAIKAWNALLSVVDEAGKLGWVQPIGADPQKVTKDMTEVFGVGAFLLAGSEMYKMVNK